MKKKIILIAVVIFVSLGLLSISKIVQNKYLYNKSGSVVQKANNQASTAVNVKENDKPDVKPIIVEAPAKTSVQNKSEAVVKNATVNKTEEKTTQTKPRSTENVVVPKVIPKEAGAKSPEPKKQPNLVIKDYISGKIILSINVSTENKTVGEITLSELDNRGISYSVSGRGETVYLTMINNLKARGKGPLSGWCYYVNGSKPGVSCGAYKLKSGDVVEWKYLEDAINN
ncbi:DUF4430 domain-containing protein [Clostridium estertheticum]|uniref:DUF4430 domain-containing protein n=1 Tax=Clostridium estertheticum TaxID=238834 RepID=UPI0013E914E5|nr:DUF4430 domain-containing protein [Clostridium estertheticum]MBZ9688410.1 DUF4430 domain-containing protein [Clostridium estertheticum]